MDKRPKKSTGEVGTTRITTTDQGMRAEIIPTQLPGDKEGVESFFAERFVNQFNIERPLGPDVDITALYQNNTSDLDFRISCPIASYLELKELNPRSEPFGRAAYGTGEIPVYEYASWIYSKLILKSARTYGETARNIILLLYPTHWQFFVTGDILRCLKSFVCHNECSFSAVFILRTNGSDIQTLEKLHPHSGPPLPKPDTYSQIMQWNLEPGRNRWPITFRVKT